MTAQTVTTKNNSSIAQNNRSPILGKSSFWQVIWITVKMAAINLVFTYLIALLFALPMAIASSPAAAIFLFIYQQKNGLLRFTLENFDMEKVSRLYARPEYKGKLKVEAGAKPCVSLKIQSKNRSIDEARRFVAAWSDN